MSCSGCRGASESVMFCNDCSKYFCRADFEKTHGATDASGAGSSGSGSGSSSSGSSSSSTVSLDEHKFRPLVGVHGLDDLSVGHRVGDEDSQPAKRRKREQREQAEKEAAEQERARKAEERKQRQWGDDDEEEEDDRRWDDEPAARTWLTAHRPLAR